MHALVIDDSRVMRMIVGQILRDLGYTVREAANGREGLTRLGESPAIHVALVDWNMPEMNGLDFVRALRADRQYDGVQVIMVTAETEREQIQEALTAGANEYVMKPFTKEMIADKINLIGI